LRSNLRSRLTDFLNVWMRAPAIRSEDQYTAPESAADAFIYLYKALAEADRTAEPESIARNRRDATFHAFCHMIRKMTL